MQKNKTHRIISISPTSQNSSIRNTQNKTTTPIKPIQHPTRTNTIKTTCKPDDNEMLESAYQNTERNNIVQSVFVSSYKEKDEPRESKIRRDSCKIDQILNRIGKSYEGEKSNPSTQLIKKTQISYLRQFIRQAKNIVKIREQNEGTFILTQGPYPQIQAISTTLRSEISAFFSNLHKQLYAKEKSVYEALEQKIFELKEKNITKSYQIVTLKNYIEQCEVDINNNYEGIINDMQVKELNEIVNSYTKRLQFYTAKVKTSETLKLQLPSDFSLLKSLPNIDISIHNKEEPIIVSHGVQQQAFEVENKISSMKIPSVPFNLNSTSKLSFDKQAKVKLALDEVQNIPITRLAKKKNNATENQPRVASARGKY